MQKVSLNWAIIRIGKMVEQTHIDKQLPIVVKPKVLRRVQPRRRRKDHRYQNDSDNR